MRRKTEKLDDGGEGQERLDLLTSDRSQTLNDKKFHSQVKREQDFHSRRNCTAETWYPMPMIPVSLPRRCLHLNSFFT